MFPIIIDVLFSLGLTWAVGSSTFAITFYMVALSDGTIDPSEKRLMHTVYHVLRIGQALLILALIGFALQPGFVVTNVYIAQWFLIGVVVLNGLLMTKHVMPMRFGPILAGGSWYALFFVSTLPFNETPLWIIATIYIGFLAFFYVCFNGFKKKFVKTQA